ncbi:hypothetical protein HK102_001564 [Quaeritorhiza haematococci]|nr:hypothetical protein HK102_001564 [Quaeritorhiza haematococci]
MGQQSHAPSLSLQESLKTNMLQRAVSAPTGSLEGGRMTPGFSMIKCSPFSTASPVAMTALLDEMKTVKLRPTNVKRSPGGSVVRNPSKAERFGNPTSNNEIVAQALRRKFQKYHQTEEDASPAQTDSTPWTTQESKRILSSSSFHGFPSSPAKRKLENNDDVRTDEEEECDEGDEDSMSVKRRRLFHLDTETGTELETERSTSMSAIGDHGSSRADGDDELSTSSGDTSNTINTDVIDERGAGDTRNHESDEEEEEEVEEVVFSSVPGSSRSTSLNGEGDDEDEDEDEVVDGDGETRMSDGERQDQKRTADARNSVEEGSEGSDDSEIEVIDVDADDDEVAGFGENGASTKGTLAKSKVGPMTVTGKGGAEVNGLGIFFSGRTTLI